MLATAAGTLGAPAPGADRERPVFPTEIGVVVLRATVKNPRGELVTNLDRGAFSIQENGRRQEITLFTRDDVPVSLGIALDNSGSMRDKRAAIEAAALALVRASNPRDEVFVLNFGDRTRIDVPFTTDVDVLEKGIARLDSIGGTAMREAIEAGETYLRENAVHERKSLLVVTDGNDNASVTPPERLREDAEHRAVTIHAIGLLDEKDAGKARRGRHELEELVEATGGVAYFPESLERTSAVALDLARQIRSQYTIGYSPSNQALDGSYRKIRVVAKGAERLVVRTRPGYRATRDRTSPSGPRDPTNEESSRARGTDRRRSMSRTIDGLTTALALLTLLATSVSRSSATGGEDKRSGLPPAVAKAIEANRPGAEIEKLDVEHEEGVTFYDIEFKSDKGEMDVAEDGTVLDIATVVEMQDLPAPVAEVIRKAATGTTIKQLTKSEVRAKIEKVSGKGTVSPLSTPEYVYEAELKKGGEIEVGGDGRIIKAPKSLREAATRK